MNQESGKHFDVIIVGAGISGIGAAYRLQADCPKKTYAIIEGRERMGGTWDFFRYPGRPVGLGHAHAGLFLPALDEPRGDRGRSGLDVMSLRFGRIDDGAMEFS